MKLLFINRLNDTFEESAEKLIKQEGKSEKKHMGIIAETLFFHS